MTDQEREFQWWMTNLYCDRNTAEGKERVESAMSKAIIGIHSDEDRLKRWERALFEVFVSFGDNKTAMRVFVELLEEQMSAVFEKEKTADRA